MTSMDPIQVGAHLWPKYPITSCSADGQLAPSLRSQTQQRSLQTHARTLQVHVTFISALAGESWLVDLLPAINYQATGFTSRATTVDRFVVKDNYLDLVQDRTLCVLHFLLYIYIFFNWGLHFCLFRGRILKQCLSFSLIRKPTLNYKTSVGTTQFTIFANLQSLLQTMHV